MDAKLIANLSDVLLCLVALYISLRSFAVYRRFHYLRLLILGLSMVVVSLSAAADFIASSITVVPLHTEWFIFLGQTAGLLFILLGLVKSSDAYLRSLAIINAWTLPFLLLLLLFSGILPAIRDPLLQVLFGGSRFIICCLIGVAYFSDFINKSTRFSLLMSISFFLLCMWYFTGTIQPTTSGPSIVSNLGAIIGVIGLGVLTAAISWE
jgi:hypothetical protein